MNIILISFYQVLLSSDALPACKKFSLVEYLDSSVGYGVYSCEADCTAPTEKLPVLQILILLN